ncbi:hypothetical protein BDV25DRAFT_131914 [Aspergillus avenaceus]|uniref:C2H2-type domain-containing protein n=1 Tax=Aspergillus avenaceus TaxID=36643 RepID=A0A5N6TND7_ASPAV|nr:hypothetical protein BDV25DRAFT_131914 [Aspergillus avenaceus]
MPWKAQVCPFCGIRYVNKTGLRNHLLRYIGVYRIPADGTHDVLKIEKFLNMDSDSLDIGNTPYKCPSCSEIIMHQRRFIDHVYYRQHYSDSEKQGSLATRRRSRYDPEPHRMWQPTGPFPFLRLPPG